MHLPSRLPVHSAADLVAARPAGPLLAFGEPGLDARLGGGLAVAAAHEFYADTEGDHMAALALALLLAGRSPRPGALLWLQAGRQRARPYAPGLAGLGLAPARVLLVRAPDVLAQLRAAAEAVRCRGLAAVLLECAGEAGLFDLTASRRLALAAAASGVSLFAVRGGVAVPSAAATRWRVAARPSRALLAGAPGRPAFGVALERSRAGHALMNTELEWDRDARAFVAADAGSAAALASDRAAVAADRRAA